VRRPAAHGTLEVSMRRRAASADPRSPWRLLLRRGVIPALVIAPQLPAVVALGWISGLPLLGVAPALALSGAFFAARGGYRFRARGPLHLYLGLWPFFAWWAACLSFCALAPLALAGGLLAGIAPVTAVAAAGLVASASGLRAIRRTPRVVRLSRWFADLPREFDGYRIVQISDVHCGVFAPERRVRDWARRACALDPDLVAVTGDLITSGRDHVGAVAAALGELRARDGVFACMGNHDYYGVEEELVEALRARGLRVLRNESVLLTRGAAAIRLAGVDDTVSRRADLGGALAAALPGEFVLLLAHDPDLFPAAAARRVHLTLAGHTHGGQLAVPLVARRFNLARLVTRFTSGAYREAGSELYVNRGIGTSGPPIRLGTRGEIAVITLRRGRRRD
jgi:uncharacterized protein